MSPSPTSPISPSAPLSGSVPGSYVQLLFEYLAAQGRDAAAILGEPAPPPGRERAYPAERWRAMLALAARHMDDPGLGLAVGARITPAHLGPLGYVLLASNSVAAALQRYLGYQRLVHDVSPVRHYVDGAGAVLEWSDESRAIGLLANQCGMAALVQFARAIGAADVLPLALHFVEPRPPDVAPYLALFRCPVLFGQSATRVIFPLAMMEQALGRPDPALVALLERQVQNLFAALPPRDTLEGEIRRQISRHILQGEPALEAIAQALHLSGRTLRRRLAERGWSYRALLDDTRRRLAEDYLRDITLSLPEVALLLAYSEQSAFNRAFLRWSGSTPQRWRRAAGV